MVEEAPAEVEGSCTAHSQHTDRTNHISTPKNAGATRTTTRKVAGTPLVVAMLAAMVAATVAATAEVTRAVGRVVVAVGLGAAMRAHDHR